MGRQAPVLRAQVLRKERYHMLHKEEFVSIWNRVLSPEERRVEEASALTTAFSNYAECYPEFMEMPGINKAHVLAAFLLEFASRHPYPPERKEEDAGSAPRWEQMLKRESRLTCGLPKGWEICEDERISRASYFLLTVIIERLVKKSYDPGIRTYLTDAGKVVVLSIEEIREGLGMKNMAEAQVAAERAAIEYQHLTLKIKKVKGEETVLEEVPAFQYAVASANSFEAKISDDFAIGLTQVWCADNNVWEARNWT